VFALALLTLMPSLAKGESTNQPSTFVTKIVTPTKPAAKPKTFHGKLIAIDKVLKNITVVGWRKHILMITEKTKLFKEDKPATLEDLAVGEHLVGQYSKNEEGKLVAVVLHFTKAKGEKEELEDAPSTVNPEEKQQPK
jgi:hypothetical protein